MRRLLPTLALLLLAGCATSPTPSPPAPLIVAMARRLELAHEVAWFKYANNQPVRDAQREAEVIEQMTALAAARGMETGRVRTFFIAQIDASCAEQKSLIRQWKRGAPAPTSPPRDLRTEVRADIDAVNLALLAALDKTTFTPQLKMHARATLMRDGFSQETANLATKTL